MQKRYQKIGKRDANLQVFLSIAVVYLVMSVFIRSYSFHLINVLKWNDNQLSVLQGSLGSLAIACVAISGGIIVDRIGSQKFLKRVMITLCIFLLVFNGLGQYWDHRPFTTSGLVLWNLADPPV